MNAKRILTLFAMTVLSVMTSLAVTVRYIVNDKVVEEVQANVGQTITLKNVTNSQQFSMFNIGFGGWSTTKDAENPQFVGTTNFDPTSVSGMGGGKKDIHGNGGC